MLRDRLNLFDHKYPIENLHELDLSWIIKDVQELESTMSDWESVIEELKKDVEQFDELEGRVETLENVTSGLDGLYSDVETLKIEIGKNDKAIEDIKSELADLVDRWDEIVNLLSTYAKQLVTAEANERKAADDELDIKINKLAFDTNEGFEILYRLIQQIVPTDVYNPVRGVRETLDKNNSDVYEDLRYGGFTNAELSEFGVSNDHVASLVHNNRDYALHAKKRFRRHWLFSPYSGRWMPHQNAISEVYVYGMGGVSNSMFYGIIETDGKTNDDLADYIDNNQSRYSFVNS